MEFLLKWKGYPESENSWEPAGNLSCSDLLKPYCIKHKITAITYPTDDETPGKEVEKTCTVSSSSEQNKPKRSGQRSRRRAVNNKLARSRQAAAIVMKVRREIGQKKVKTDNCKATNGKSVPCDSLKSPELKPILNTPQHSICTQARATPASSSTSLVREEDPRQQVAGFGAEKTVVSKRAKDTKESDDDDVVLLYVDPPTNSRSKTRPDHVRKKHCLSPTEAYFTAMGHYRASIMAIPTRSPNKLCHPPTRLPSPTKEGSVVHPSASSVPTPCSSPVINSPVSDNSFNLRLSPASTLSTSSGESESPCVASKSEACLRTTERVPSYVGLLAGLSPKSHDSSKSKFRRLQGLNERKKSNSLLNRSLCVTNSSGKLQRPELSNRRGRMGPVPRRCPPVQHPSGSASLQTRAAKDSSANVELHTNGTNALQSNVNKTKLSPESDHISVIFKFNGMRKQVLVRKRNLLTDDSADSGKGIKKRKSLLSHSKDLTTLLTSPTLSDKKGLPCKPLNGMLKNKISPGTLNGKLHPSSHSSENSCESLVNGLQQGASIASSGNSLATPLHFQPDGASMEVNPVPKLNFVKSVHYKQMLLDWQFQLNRQRGGTDDIIFVENEVDMAEPPKDFTYICSNIYGEGVPDPNQPQVRDSLCGCQCYHLGKRCGPKASYCCSSMADVPFAYTLAGKVCVTPGTPIYECNWKCSCPVDCANRVVQHGRKIPLCIFRTSNDRGWGVKTLQSIKINTFVTEYVGEVITSEEAERRGKGYDEEGETYLFDLDFDDDQMFTIDAKNYGNISHFFNHSVSACNYVVKQCHK